MITKRDIDISSIPLHWMAWYNIFMGIRTGLIDSGTLDDLSDTINDLSLVSNKIAIEKPDDSEFNISLESSCLEKVISEYKSISKSPILAGAPASIKDSFQNTIADFSSALLLLNSYDAVICRMQEEDWNNACMVETYSSYCFFPFYEILKPLLDHDCGIEDFTSIINNETTQRIFVGIINDSDKVKQAWKEDLLYGETVCPQIEFIPRNEGGGTTTEWDMYQYQYCGNLTLKFKGGYSQTIKCFLKLLNSLRGRLGDMYQKFFYNVHNGDSSITQIEVPYIDELYKRIDWNNYIKEPWLKLYRPHFSNECWNSIVSVNINEQALLSEFVERPVFNNIIKDNNLSAISNVSPITDKRYYSSKLLGSKEILKLLNICNKELLFFQARQQDLIGCFMDDYEISSFKSRLIHDELFYDNGNLIADIFWNQKCQYSKSQLVYALDVVGTLYLALESIERQAIRQIDVKNYVQRCIEQDQVVIEILTECIDSSSLPIASASEKSADNPWLRKAIEKGLVDENGKTSKSISDFAADLVLNGIVRPKLNWNFWVNEYRTSKDIDGIAETLLRDGGDFHGQWKPLNNIFKSKDGNVLSARQLNQAFMDYKKKYIIKGNEKMLVRTGAIEVITRIILKKFNIEQSSLK